MDTILSAVLSSMHADMARMERVAMNVANAQTPGYKREVVSAPAFATQLAAAADVLAVLQSGELKGKKIGSVWRITRAALNNYLSE